MGFIAKFWNSTLNLILKLRRITACWARAAIVLSASTVLAQAPEATPPQPSPPPSEAGMGENRPIRESGPPVMFLKNKKGELVVVPSITMEELDRLLQLDRGVPSTSPPRFTFADTIQLTGSVLGSVAEIEARFTIRVIPSGNPAGEWLRIPLRLHQAIWTSPIEVEGGGELYTDYQPAGDGYIVWLRSPEKADIKLSLKLKVPIGSANGEKHLDLSVPNRSTTVRLSVSSPEAEGRINEESNSTLTTTRTKDNHTEFVIEGSGGIVQLIWRDVKEPPPVLQADGNVLVKLAGRSFDVEAQLRVRSYGPPIESFSVRLPPGVLLTSSPLSHNGFQVSAQIGKNGQLVNVRRLDGKTSNPIEVRLKAASIATANSQAGSVDLSGFEVIGAQIQRGTIDFLLEDDWSVDWKSDANLRRVEVPEALRPQQVIARFEYDRQPFSLRAVIGKGESRVNVEPTYVVTVEPFQLKLDGSLRYRVSGPRAEKLVVDTGGWTIDRIAPAELLNGQWNSDKGVIEIPLSSTATGRGEFELQISGHQTTNPPGLSWSIPFGNSGIPALLAWEPAICEPWIRHLATDVIPRDMSFSLPRPIASAATPGLVIIVPADNVELTPQPERSRGLVADMAPPQLKLPVRQQPPLVYREDVVGQSSLFAGVLKMRRQTVAIAVENRVRVQEQEVQVEQRMNFQIAYEPAHRLAFDVPRTLHESGKLEVLFEGTAVSVNPVESDDAEEPDRRLVEIELQDKRIGQCEVLFRYHIPRVLSSVSSASAFTAALVRPRQTESIRVASSSLRLSSAGSLRVSLVDDQLRPLEDETNGITIGNELLFQLEQVPASISIAALATEATGRRTTVIDRVWVQSLLTNSERRDRACFRLSTNESHLTFILPYGAGSEDINPEVVLNGQRTDRFVLTNGRELRIGLPETLGRHELTVELWYWFTAQPAAFGRLYLKAPQLSGASHADRAYWELRLPANEHLVWTSGNLISENSWHWGGYFLTRTPHRTQHELEQWVQASHHGEDRGFNSYVFSSVGTLGSNTVMTAMRPFAMFVVAGSVFAAGALLLYVPGLRHPLLLFAVGSALATVAVGFPEPTLAAGQIITLGLALVILARLLMAVLSRHPVPRVATRGSTYGPSDSRSSNATPRRTESRIDSGSGVGTATISAPLQMSASSNEP